VSGFRELKNHNDTGVSCKDWTFLPLASLFKGKLNISPARLSLLAGLSLVGLGLALYLPTMLKLPLSRAEAMYALIPKEMLDSGAWLTPTLNGTRYLDKPPLLYWLTLVAYKIFGVTAWSARLPTLGMALGEIWLTFAVGRRLLGNRAAWLGGFALLTSIGFFSLHLELLTDHLVTLFLLGSLYCLMRGRESPGLKWALGFHLCLAGGFFAKGLIGVAFPLLIAGGVALHWREARLKSLIFHPGGLALLGALTLFWFGMQEWLNPGFFRHHVINEQVLRFLGRRQPPDISPFTVGEFYIFVGLWLLPWSVLLPEALWRFGTATRRGGELGAPGSLLLIWAGVVLGFFTLSSMRIEYYSLPALPPLALICGWRLHRGLAAARNWSLAGAFAVLGLMGLTLCLLLPHLEGMMAENRREFLGMLPSLMPLASRVSYLIAGLALLGALAALARQGRAALAGFAALALVLMYYTSLSLMALSPYLSDHLAGDYVQRHSGPRDVVVMENIEEFEYVASLAFYSGRRIQVVRRGELPQFPYPVLPREDFLISPGGLKELWQGPGRLFLLADDGQALEPFSRAAPVAWQAGGKRLLTNDGSGKQAASLNKVQPPVVRK
jgi:4-amino-4-deoxy-L-arabinose transferase-like glycosyltransferase